MACNYRDVDHVQKGNEVATSLRYHLSGFDYKDEHKVYSAQNYYIPGNVFAVAHPEVEDSLQNKWKLRE